MPPALANPPVRGAWLVPIAIALWAALAGLAPNLTLKIALLSPLLIAPVIWWLLNGRDRWLVAFFTSAILLPPLPFALGDSGPHIACLFAVPGALLTIAGWSTLRISHVRLVFLATLFLAALLISDMFAAFYAGPQVALLSLARIALFAISPLVLLHAISTPDADPARALRFCRLLFRLAVAAAVFACIDFRYQLPSPAGFSAQFVWLESEVLRRAQGLFYEASTLGNFCAFFLLFAVVSFVSPRKLRACSRTELAAGSAVLATALVFSYSRASLLNLLCGTTAFVLTRRNLNRRILIAIIAGPVAIALGVAAAFPDFWQSYWIRLQTSVVYFYSAPEAILSGRLGSWTTLFQFAINNPGHLIFGIGYKTLPYSNFIGRETIADNTYLELLIETGLVGLTALLAFSIEVFRTTYRAARDHSTISGMLAIFFFCFWIGESVQMLSGDLITYWRVLPIYFWTLGTALRSQEHTSNGLNQERPVRLPQLQVLSDRLPRRRPEQTSAHKG